MIKFIIKKSWLTNSIKKNWIHFLKNILIIKFILVKISWLSSYFWKISWSSNTLSTFFTFCLLVRDIEKPSQGVSIEWIILSLSQKPFSPILLVMSKNIIIIWRKLGRFFFFSTPTNPKLFLSENDDMVIETQKPGPSIPSPPPQHFL